MLNPSLLVCLFNLLVVQNIMIPNALQVKSRIHGPVGSAAISPGNHEVHFRGFRYSLVAYLRYSYPDNYARHPCPDTRVHTTARYL